ncbi:MAG: autotransporter-associated beta strand repeat-containing protein, partial [Kiritimatiellia bacterium]|nr:autotransporter-associated beta strand repeat-containing protein [Kiritimatiellia bacterium]
MKKRMILTAVVGLVLFLAPQSNAASLWFDLNGSAENFGDPGIGNWDNTTANWNTESLGTNTPVLWTNPGYPSADTAVFRLRNSPHNGTLASPNFLINVVGTQHVAQFTYDYPSANIRTAYIVLTNGVIRAEGQTFINYNTGTSSNSTFHVYSDIHLGTNFASTTGFAYIFATGGLSGGGNNQLILEGKITSMVNTQNTFIALQSISPGFNPQSSKLTLTASSSMSDGAGSGKLNVIYGHAASDLARGGRIEVYSTNSYSGTTSFRGGKNIIYVNALSGQNGAFGNATTALRFGAVPTGDAMHATNTLSLLTGVSGITMGRNIDIEPGFTNNTLYGVTIGGEHTSGTSTFSGNINLSTSGGVYPRTNVVQLTAATGGRVLFSGNLTETTPTAAVPIEKVGGGIVELSGANTYRGGTIVTEGTLLVTGSLTGTGAVTVATGAILGGNGYIRGNTTVNGTLAPGTSAGDLTFNGHLTLGSGSTSAFEINGLLVGQYDRVLLSSLGTQNLTLAGTLDLTVGVFSANPG